MIDLIFVGLVTFGIGYLVGHREAKKNSVKMFCQAIDLSTKALTHEIEKSKKDFYNGKIKIEPESETPTIREGRPLIRGRPWGAL